MTQLSHTLTPSFSSCIYSAHLLHRCFALAQSALGCYSTGTKFHTVYAADFIAQNYFYLRREASVRMQPAHRAFSTSSHHHNTIISHSCTECKNVALGGVDTSFFSLFSTKKCAFLLFFGYFCTFLIYIANF